MIRALSPQFAARSMLIALSRGEIHAEKSFGGRPIRSSSIFSRKQHARNEGRLMDGNCDKGEFLFRRRRAIQEQRAIQEEVEHRAHLNRLSLGIPTVVGCVKVLRSAGLKDKEVACLLQGAADVPAAR